MLYKNRKTGENVDVVYGDLHGWEGGGPVYCVQTMDINPPHVVVYHRPDFEELFEQIPIALKSFDMRDSNVLVVPISRHQWDVTLEVGMTMTMVTANDCTKIVVRKDES